MISDVYTRSTRICSSHRSIVNVRTIPYVRAMTPPVQQLWFLYVRPGIMVGL